LARRQLGEGRINKLFTGKTSVLSDPDIKDLIIKYPDSKENKKQDTLPNNGDFILGLSHVVQNDRKD
jgi:hypothetical protein